MSIDQSNSTTKLPLFLTPKSMKLKYSPQQYSSGVLTPPIHTCLASVPFKWELHPGKPRPYCTDIIISTIFNDQPKFLEPPPRFYYLDKMTKIPSSPKINNVLERGQLGALVLYKNDDNSTNNNVRRRGSYWWQQWFAKRRIKKEIGVGGGNLVISSSSSDCGTGTGLERNGYFSGLSHSHIWVSFRVCFLFTFPSLRMSFFKYLKMLRSNF
ncbi:hypothetical protein MTR67_042575 [Solanum verrucosum]|uniref:Uncharacterized protein n=1 Tax=Solanum verrucosum TaxID=315347 RepID=A0AAF0ZTT9_SOLVR|nr:hypothetical protein MTR67_042575 [Solanum verrucosum]